MTTRRRITVAIAAIALLPGALVAIPASAAPVTATLEGFVTDTSGQPLEGIRVSAGNSDWQATRTDSKGRYTLRVRAGSGTDMYFGDSRRVYMSSLKQNFTVTAGRSYRVDRALPKPAFITGTITDLHDLPLEGAHASLYVAATGERADSRSYRAGSSDSDGDYRIRVAPGTYVLRFEYVPSDGGGRWFGGESRRSATVITVDEGDRERGVDIRIPRT